MDNMIANIENNMLYLHVTGRGQSLLMLEQVTAGQDADDELV